MFPFWIDMSFINQNEKILIINLYNMTAVHELGMNDHKNLFWGQNSENHRASMGPVSPHWQVLPWTEMHPSVLLKCLKVLSRWPIYLSILINTHRI